MNISKYKNRKPLLALSVLLVGAVILCNGLVISPSVAAAQTLNQQLKAACGDYEVAFKKAGKTKGVELSSDEKKPHSYCKNFKNIDPSGSGERLLKQDLKDTKSATGSINTKISKGGKDGGKDGDKKSDDSGGPTGPFSLSTSDLGLDNNSPTDLKGILNAVYTVAGSVAVLMIVISGLLMVVNGDNPQNVAKARNSVIFTAVGLMVIILAFVITNVVLAIV